MSAIAPSLALRRVHLSRAWPWLALPGWAALIYAGRELVLPLQTPASRLLIGAPPLVGHLRMPWLSPGALAAAIVIAVAAVALLPALTLRLRWPAMLTLTGLTAAGWTYALAASTGGWPAFVAPLLTRYEYLRDVHAVGGLHAFLSGFVHAIGLRGPALLATHVRGHPPGLLLLLAALDHVGLGGATPLAVLVLVAAAITPVAAIVTARAVAGDDVARRAAPFLAVAPLALWVGTSADALFMAVAATAIAMLAVARRDRGALGAGVVFGGALMLSYGLAPLALVGVAVAWRRPRLLIVAGAGALAVLGAFALDGFNWLEGLARTRSLALDGVQSLRPYAPFLVVSLAAFAAALGPAAALGLARLRDRRLWLVCGAALAGIAFADLSGISRGETERIWLPFAPWLLIATGAARLGRVATIALLALQAYVALRVQAQVRTPW